MSEIYKFSKANLDKLADDKAPVLEFMKSFSVLESKVGTFEGAVPTAIAASDLLLKRVKRKMQC